MRRPISEPALRAHTGARIAEMVIELIATILVVRCRAIHLVTRHSLA